MAKQSMVRINFIVYLQFRWQKGTQINKNQKIIVSFLKRVGEILKILD